MQYRPRVTAFLITNTFKFWYNISIWKKHNFKHLYVLFAYTIFDSLEGTVPFYRYFKMYLFLIFI